MRFGNFFNFRPVGRFVTPSLKLSDCFFVFFGMSSARCSCHLDCIHAFSACRALSDAVTNAVSLFCLCVFVLANCYAVVFIPFHVVVFLLLLLSVLPLYLLFTCVHHSRLPISACAPLDLRHGLRSLVPVYGGGELLVVES